ncbi:RagB/SusD family nutrient uptake outer membrane protein [Chitinophaga defluvii]|uniref:RagB/SusD family nutrient uptake outer membrane protein n=1 Tax=Chitinophaga defluvii TaxID=3163343 RepID=A0ABV2T1R4_9BACT
MNMKNIYRPVLGALLSFLVLPSCSTDKYLDLPPAHALVPENAIRDEASSIIALNGVYSLLAGNDFGAYYSGAFGFMSGYQNNANGLTSVYSFSTKYEDAIVENTWKASYKVVNAANVVIEGVNKLPGELFQGDKKATIIAEAKFLRAFAHFNIFRFYGRWFDAQRDPNSEWGIILRKQSSDLSNVKQRRSSVADTYQFILDDLDAAIKEAPDFISGVRASRLSAKVVKAQVLLNRGTGDDYKTVLTLCDEILNSGKRKLEGDFADVFKKAWSSSELIFSRFVEPKYRATDGYKSWFRAQSKPADIFYDLLQGDPRFKATIDTVLTMDDWNTTKYPALIKVTGSNKEKEEPVPTYFSRLPEVYFMKAECLARTGANITTAIAPVNIVRARVGLPALQPANQQALMDAIYEELVKEIGLENGSEWFASLRFTTPDGRQRIYGQKTSGTDIVEDRFIFPIPFSEISFNDLIKQNPGY